MEICLMTFSVILDGVYMSYMYVWNIEINSTNQSTHAVVSSPTLEAFKTSPRRGRMRQIWNSDSVKGYINKSCFLCTI